MMTMVLVLLLNRSSTREFRVLIDRHVDISRLDGGCIYLDLVSTHGRQALG